MGTRPGRIPPRLRSTAEARLHINKDAGWVKGLSDVRKCRLTPVYILKPSNLAFSLLFVMKQCHKQCLFCAMSYLKALWNICSFPPRTIKENLSEVNFNASIQLSAVCLSFYLKFLPLFLKLLLGLSAAPLARNDPAP